MGLEHVGPLGADERSDLVQPTEQVVRAVIRKRGPRHAHHPRAAAAGDLARRTISVGRAACEEVDDFVAWSRSNDRVLVTELAQNMTPNRQMAANPTPTLGIELGDVEDLQSLSPDAKGATRRAAEATLRRGPHAIGAVSSGLVATVAPFAKLATRQGRPLRIAILSDFTRISYANGAVFQTRFLYQELRRCGHQVTVIGPRDPDAKPDEVPPGTVALPSVPLKMYPGLHVPMPLASWVFDPDRYDFDLCFAQTTSLLLEFGLWLREMKGVPLLCVNTTHLVAAYDVLLPERLSKSDLVQAGLHLTLKRPYERLFANIYNQSDGLVVLSEGLRTYWRERGVVAPIHVIPRTVQPDVFDRPLGADPYTELLEGAGLPQRGPRLVCAGRHTREKAQDRVIRIFAHHVLPHEPDATLTLVGDGPDSAYYQRVAREVGAADRVLFPGEVAWTKMPDFYRYADVFMHASLSETYGNVMGEALWCGTPTVAFADGMGVTSQIQDGSNGVLFAPGKGEKAEREADGAFGRAVVALLRDPRERGRLGVAAAKRARERCAPAAVQERIAAAFQDAQDHAVASALRPMARRPKVLQWLTTFRRARPWMTYNGVVYLSGHLRPARTERRERAHPRIA
jgi:glycosyltransferase involved in cell wall biosynthesis